MSNIHFKFFIAVQQQTYRSVSFRKFSELETDILNGEMKKDNEKATGHAGKHKEKPVTCDKTYITLIELNSQTVRIRSCHMWERVVLNHRLWLIPVRFLSCKTKDRHQKHLYQYISLSKCLHMIKML